MSSPIQDQMPSVTRPGTDLSFIGAQTLKLNGHDLFNAHEPALTIKTEVSSDASSPKPPGLHAREHLDPKHAIRKYLVSP